MSQEWGGRRRSTPLGQIERGKPSQEEKGNLFMGFAVAVSPAAVWSQFILFREMNGGWDTDPELWRRASPHGEEESIKEEEGGRKVQS